MCRTDTGSEVMSRIEGPMVDVTISSTDLNPAVIPAMQAMAKVRSQQRKVRID